MARLLLALVLGTVYSSAAGSPAPGAHGQRTVGATLARAEQTVDHHPARSSGPAARGATGETPAPTAHKPSPLALASPGARPLVQLPSRAHSPPSAAFPEAGASGIPRLSRAPPFENVVLS